jgi:hypothetical protein
VRRVCERRGRWVCSFLFTNLVGEVYGGDVMCAQHSHDARLALKNRLHVGLQGYLSQRRDRENPNKIQENLRTEGVWSRNPVPSNGGFLFPRRSNSEILNLRGFSRCDDMTRYKILSIVSYLQNLKICHGAKSLGIKETRDGGEIGSKDMKGEKRIGKGKKRV